MSDLAQLLAVPGAGIEADDDFEAINALMRERGWSDGLPIVPPTEARVAAMLAYCDRPWDQPIAKIPPRWGEATPLRLAANAVMAGCRPQYFPLLMLAIEAMCEQPFNLYGIQATNSRFNSRMTVAICSTITGARPSEGSSRIRSAGLAIRAMAMTIFPVYFD